MPATVQGSKKVQAALDGHRDHVEGNLPRALLMGALFLQRESQKIVPVDTGLLRNSANSRVETLGRQVTAIVSYGTDYGIYVHEDLEARHKPGKQAKYLSDPLVKHQKKIADIVKQNLKK